MLSAADGVISSGVLATGSNRELIPLLHRWRNEVADFNRRLDLTETLTFLQGTPEVVRGFEHALHRAENRLRRVSVLLDDLLNLLTAADGDRGTASVHTRRWPVLVRISTPRPTSRRDNCDQAEPVAS